MGLLNGALPFAMISWGEQYIPSGWAALLQSTTPIFTILLAHLLTHDDRITWRKALGVAVGFTGVGLLILPELQEGLSASVWGMLAIVGSSVSYAFAAIFAHRSLSGQQPMASAAGQFRQGSSSSSPSPLLSNSRLRSLSPGRLWQAGPPWRSGGQSSPT